MRSATRTVGMTPSSRKNPFMASLKERHKLNKEGSGKCTIHVVLDLEGSDIDYRPGDSIGIFPQNHPDLVDKTLRGLRATGEEIVMDRNDEEISLRDFLTGKANIQSGTKKLLKALDPDSPLLEDKPALKEYLANRELWDLLLDYPGHNLESSDLPRLLLGLLPRLYSIASSTRHVGNEVHLTIATLNYSTNSHTRHGICSDYLWHQLPLNEPLIATYLQPTKDFLLPEDDAAPIIMIGPGTGIAPFRAFMQERKARGATGKNWLFFGEWNRTTDFYYESEWDSFPALEVTTAFSRDQAHKVYVQDRLREEATKIWSWIADGAIIYVCGDKDKMAKDVDAALHDIAEQEGHVDAKVFLKQLRKEGRYLRDVY